MDSLVFIQDHCGELSTEIYLILKVNGANLLQKSSGLRGQWGELTTKSHLINHMAKMLISQSAWDPHFPNVWLGNLHC